MIYMRSHGSVSHHVALTTSRWRSSALVRVLLLQIRPDGHATKQQTRHISSRRHLISEGRTTQASAPSATPSAPDDFPRRSPFYFETGYSIFAKRATRPFPPPFISPPSGSFSDPLTTHTRVQYRKPTVDGELLSGITNGDDAILTHSNFLAVNDGVGAWAQKERGHAALWSRLIAHYWARETHQALDRKATIELDEIDTVGYLETAFERTKTATKFGEENQIMGTTTASGALLHHKDTQSGTRIEHVPMVIATSLGDCAVLIIRPGLGAAEGELVYKSREDWHWFDCPRQLGTNSPDTPKKNSSNDVVEVKEGDLVVCVSDGVTDNLYEEEIVEYMDECVRKWSDREKEAEDGVVYCARTLMNAAKEVALDPYAGSPYMSRAVDEGLAAEGGKLDDISVVIGVVRRDKAWKKS